MKARTSKTFIYPILVLLLTLILGLCAFGLMGMSPAVNAQAVTEEPTDLTYLLNEDSQSYKVRILDKTLKNISIPSTYNDLPVTAIDDGGFTGCTALEKIFIPSSVKYIGNNAFMRCTNLKKVLGMAGVTFYGNNAFSMCSKLEYLILPSRIQNAGTNMLRNVKANVYSRTLESDLLNLNPDCLALYSGNMVYGNELVYEEYVDPQTNEQGLSLVSWQNLDLYENGFEEETTLEISSWIENIKGNGPNEGKLLNIANSAFSSGYYGDTTLNCNAKSIVIKKSEGYNHSINIESYAFAGSMVGNITIEVDFTLNDPIDGKSIAIFQGAENLKSVSLSDSLIDIPSEMFSDCSALEEIKLGDAEKNHLPSKIKRIESKAFYGCTKLPELHINEDIVFIGENAFVNWGKTNNKQILYIYLEEAGVDWSPRWNYNLNNEIIEYVGLKEVELQLKVEQDKVINAKGGTIKAIPRNSTLRELNLTAPSSDSHLFTGKWYTSESRTAETEFDLDKPIKSAMVLYAGWEIKTFTISFPQLKCCSFYGLDQEPLDTQIKKFEYGETYTFYISRNVGYKDIKIYSNGKLLEPVSGDVYVVEMTQNINITVTSNLEIYYIYYKNVRGGYNPNENVITSYTVESDTITFGNPSWAAYEIGYWNIPSIETNSTGNKDITAVWKNPVTFTIKFTLDDDPNAINPNGATRNYTVEDTVSLLNPMSPGRESGVWQTKSGKVVSSWNSDEYFENLELSVKWGKGKQYEVSFNLNGGSGNNAKIVATYGDLLPSITKPTKYDYKFLGYYSTNNGQLYYNSEMGSNKWYQTANDTLEAKWEREYYYVTFVQTGGTGTGGTSRIRIKYGDKWPNISMPTRKGYAVDGYYLDYDIDNRRIYNADGTPNPNTIYGTIYFYFNRDLELRCNWEAVDHYSFVIQLKHFMESQACTVQTYYLPYDGSLEFTADERRTWTEYTEDGKGIIRRESRAFTRWVMNLNGEQAFDPQTNPWIILSYDRTLKYDVSTIIEQYYPDYQPTPSPGNIYIRAIYRDDYKNELSCVAEGTLITLADGSQIPVEQLKGDEKLLVWNLYTGAFDIAPILFIDQDPARMYETINLYFSDGTTVKVITEHGFWDFNLNKYVYLGADSAQYIGHWFNKQIVDESGQISWIKVQLTNVVILEEFTTTWSPVTYGHLCYYVNGMLSMPGGIGGLFNIFDVDEDMKYNIVAMETDIEEYGLFTYEEFAEIVPVPEEIFNAVSGQYLKVAIGKGLITIEGLQALVNRYSVFFD